MRHSSKKHVLAILRDVIGIKQDGMHEIIGCSLSTVVQIEAVTGKRPLRLSEKLAKRISHQTGVSVSWLLENDTSKPPVTIDGEAYTREVFERKQASFHRKGTETEFLDHLRIQRMAFDNVASVLRILVKALQKGDLHLINYRLREALGEVETPLGKSSIADTIARPDGDFALTRNGPDFTPVITAFRTAMKKITTKK